MPVKSQVNKSEWSVLSEERPVLRIHGKGSQGGVLSSPDDFRDGSGTGETLYIVLGQAETRGQSAGSEGSSKNGSAAILREKQELILCQ